MGYHILEPIRGSPDAPHICFWKRLGIDYDLPIVPRDEAVPPNRVRLIVVKTVNDAGDLTRGIGEDVDWELYEPYGSAAIEPFEGFPPEEVTEQHRREDPADLVEEVAGTLPIPQPSSTTTSSRWVTISNASSQQSARQAMMSGLSPIQRRQPRPQVTIQSSTRTRSWPL